MKSGGLKVQLNLNCPYLGEKYFILSFPKATHSLYHWAEMIWAFSPIMLTHDYSFYFFIDECIFAVEF
jgi:hypothetical protein